MRIDIENFKPGKEPGQLHLHHGNEKYYFDPSIKEFIDAPKSINELTRTPELQRAIEKGLRYLGENT